MQMGKFSVEVCLVDWLMVKGNCFGVWFGLEVKFEVEKVKSIFGLVFCEDFIKECGGYIKFFFNMEGKILGDKFQNWMCGNFYCGDQDIVWVMFIYVNVEGYVIIYMFNNVEVLVMGDCMNLMLVV